MPLQPSLRLRRSPDVLETTVMDLPVLLHSTRWNYLQFDRVGGAIWNLLEQPMSLDTLVPMLRRRFDVDEETCRRDCERLLQKLWDEKFLVADE